MKIYIVILSWAGLAILGLNEHAAWHANTALVTPRINALRLIPVPGCAYLKPCFVYEITGEKPPVKRKGSAKSGPKVTDVLPPFSRPKWFYDDLNKVIMHKLVPRKEGGC